MTHQEIAQLRMHNQHLVSAIIKTASDLVYHFGAVQAQEYDQTKWGLGIRLQQLDDAAIETEISTGNICRTHLLRPTWHFVHINDIGWMQALSSERVQAINKYMYRQLELNDKTLNRANNIIMKSLGNGESLTRAELATVLSRERIKADGLRMTYIMMNAELEGLVRNGKRKGKQHTYSLLHLENITPADKEEGLSRLAERYFRSRGPATVKDFSTWSGLTVADCQSGINVNRDILEKIILGSEIYFHVPPVSSNSNDLPALKMKKELFLLPVYDEMIMGYKNRESIMQQCKKGQQHRYDCMMLYNGQVIGTYKRTISSKTAFFSFDYFQSPSDKQNNLVKAALKKFEQFFNLKTIVSPR
ncbi:winged helix DNA-binding domain-containing protein [Flavitalea antarctica]